jgi:hypothetical protein
MSTDLKTRLEDAIDATSLAHVLELVSDICYEKSQHIQESYAVSRSTDPLARAWYKASARIQECASNPRVSAVSGVAL